MPMSMSELVGDLRAETADLRRMLAPLDAAGWQTPTPAPGWAIRDQVSHLAYFDEAAITAATDPQRFRAEAAELMARGEGAVDDLAARYRPMPPTELLAWFEDARRRLTEVLDGLDPAVRVPWYGPDMSAASFATARLMETWAHGQDVADALGERRPPTARLRHVALLGVRALPYSFAVRGEPAPDVPVRVELTLPDGTSWTYGPPEAADVVCGTALDFALVVTRRRHLLDTELSVTGPVATRWMRIAQAFAGPPGAGRAPGQFPAG